MYTVHVLDNKSFDRLPHTATGGANIGDSAGFANTETNQAYVRYSANSDLQRYLVDHELSELVEENSEHADEKIPHIRHLKFFKEIFAPYIAPALTAMIPGVGPALAPFVAAGGGALKKSTEPGRQSAGELLGSAAKSGASAYGIGKLTGNLGVPSGGGQSFLGNLGASLKSGFGAGNIPGNLSGMLSGLFGKGGQTGAGAIAPTTAAPAGTMLGSAGVPSYAPSQSLGNIPSQMPQPGSGILSGGGLTQLLKNLIPGGGPQGGGPQPGGSQQSTGDVGGGATDRTGGSLFDMFWWHKRSIRSWGVSIWLRSPIPICPCAASIIRTIKRPSRIIPTSTGSKRCSWRKIRARIPTIK